MTTAQQAFYTAIMARESGSEVRNAVENNIRAAEIAIKKAIKYGALEVEFEMAARLNIPQVVTGVIKRLEENGYRVYRTIRYTQSDVLTTIVISWDLHLGKDVTPFDIDTKLRSGGDEIPQLKV